MGDAVVDATITAGPSLTGVFADPAMQARLERYGYVVVPWLSRTEATALLRTWKDDVNAVLGPAFTVTPMSGNPAFRRRQGQAICAAFTPAIERLIPGMRPHIGAFVGKVSADPKTHLEFHQDPTYVDEFRVTTVNVWVPLVDTDERNGTLYVVPGSHLLNRYPRGYNREGFPYMSMRDDLWHRLAIPLNVRCGDAVIFHQQLFHASCANRSETERVAAVAVLAPAGEDLLYFHDNRQTDRIDVYQPGDGFYYSYRTQVPITYDPATELRFLGSYDLRCEPLDLTRAACGVARALETPDLAARCDEVAAAECRASSADRADRDAWAAVHGALLDELHSRAVAPEMPVLRGPAWRDVAAWAFERIGAQAPTHFTETVHTLPFPREQGFAGAHALHHGDVFARALVLDALCDARAFGFELATGTIEREREYLISMRRSERDGWAYFPSLLELPADADDLAAVVRALHRSGAAVEEFSPAIARWTEGVAPDGAFETWIPSETPAVAALQAEWVRRAWGSGYDVDVAARCAAALAPFVAPGLIERLRDRIARAQAADGSWSSSWYCGRIYPTLLAVQALAGDAARRKALEKAVGFLLEAQAPDGSWALGSEASALASAHGAWALAIAGGSTVPVPLRAGIDRALASALAWLRDRWCTDGRCVSSEPEPLIRMDLGRAQGDVRSTLTYASRCINDAMLFQASVACSHYSQEGRP